MSSCEILWHACYSAVLPTSFLLCHQTHTKIGFRPWKTPSWLRSPYATGAVSSFPAKPRRTLFPCCLQEGKIKLQQWGQQPLGCISSAVGAAAAAAIRYRNTCEWDNLRMLVVEYTIAFPAESLLSSRKRAFSLLQRAMDTSIWQKPNGVWTTLHLSTMVTDRCIFEQNADE